MEGLRVHLFIRKLNEPFRLENKSSLTRGFLFDNFNKIFIFYAQKRGAEKRKC